MLVLNSKVCGRLNAYGKVMQQIRVARFYSLHYLAKATGYSPSELCAFELSKKPIPNDLAITLQNTCIFTKGEMDSIKKALGF